MPKIHSYFSTFAEASIYASPLLKRIQLAKARCKSYPMDSMDFVLADLERPDTYRRGADFCTGDLTGRYLEMLARSMHHDGSDRERLDELFYRILKCRTKEGPVGRTITSSDLESWVPFELERVFGVSYKLFNGLIHYYLTTGDGKALDLAWDQGVYFYKHLDEAKKILDGYKKRGAFHLFWWITEPLAMLYGITGEKRWLEPCAMIADALPAAIDGAHSHGFMATLRGLQLAAIYSGDLSFNTLPEKFRKEIAQRAEWADGNIPEGFPISEQNEGCSIADWLMLNLYSGFISGNDEAYDKAETICYNALSLNQFINGALGHRKIFPDRRRYGSGVLRAEAWWCCIHNGANGFIEFADHAVTFRDNTVRVNLLVPGMYRFNLDGRAVSVEITTSYPEKAQALVCCSGLPEGTGVKVRLPPWVRNGAVREEFLPGNRRRYTLSGDMGYYIEAVQEGVVLKYGPLVMAPLSYNSESLPDEDLVNAAPEGYIPEVMPTDIPSLVPAKTKDAAGFLEYEHEPVPVWGRLEEGPPSRIAYGGFLPVNVPLYYPDGKIHTCRFYPELLSTTTSGSNGFPFVFNP
jgi:hypothetical protein